MWSILATIYHWRVKSNSLFLILWLCQQQQWIFSAIYLFFFFHEDLIFSRPLAATHFRASQVGWSTGECQYNNPQIQSHTSTWSAGGIGQESIQRYEWMPKVRFYSLPKYGLEHIHIKRPPKSPHQIPHTCQLFVNTGNDRYSGKNG